MFQPTVAVDVAITYTPTRRTVQVSNNIVRTWRVQPTVAVDVAITYLTILLLTCTVLLVGV
jgi:hypothetical protein